MNASLSKKQRTQKITPWAIFCWCLFDWAVSGFPTIIITFVFSTYFMKAVVGDTIRGTSYWGWSFGVALLSPIFGAISDQTGHHKRWLVACSLCCMVSVALLWFTKPNPSWIYWALIFVNLANISQEIGQLFYNALMVYIAPKGAVSQMFGLYNLSGRISVFIGPMVVATITELFDSQRLGMSVIFLMFLIGFLLLLPLPEAKKV